MKEFTLAEFKRANGAVVVQLDECSTRSSVSIRETSTQQLVVFKVTELERLIAALQTARNITTGGEVPREKRPGPHPCLVESGRVKK